MEEEIMEEIMEPLNNPPAECLICMSDIPSKEMIKYLCGHELCPECFQSSVKAYNYQISARTFFCYYLDCKQEVKDLGNLVNKIKDQEIVQRFKYLSQKKKANKLKDAYVCPDKECLEIVEGGKQETVQKEYAKLEELNYDYLICPKCYNLFYKVCKVKHETDERAPCMSRESTGEATGLILMMVLFIIMLKKTKYENIRIENLILQYFK